MKSNEQTRCVSRQKPFDEQEYLYSKRKNLTSMNRKNKTPIMHLHGRNSYLQDTELYQVDSEDSESMMGKQKGHFRQNTNTEVLEQPTSLSMKNDNQIVHVSKFLEK